MKINVNKFNIKFGAILFSLLIAEMVAGVLFHFYVVRFIQLLILINGVKQGFKKINNYIFFLIPVIIFLFYSIGYLKIGSVQGDVFNIIWWSLYIMIMNYSIKTPEDYTQFRSILFKSTFYLTSILAAIGLVKLYLSNIGIFLPNMLVVRADGYISSIQGTSLAVDYNIYSIGILCGVVAGMYCYRLASSVKTKLLYSMMMIVSLLSSMLSMSRRGLVLSIFLLVVLFFWSFRAQSWNKIKHAKLITKAPWLALLATVTFIFLVITVDFGKLIDSSSELLQLQKRIETIKTITSEENDSRGSRWSYAADYYAELPLLNQIFGNGFEYLNDFALHFHQEQGVVDHPHNVWISSILYGGVFGFVFTTWLTLYTLLMYIKNRAKLQAIFYWYLLFLLLNFTSSNTVFSSRVFVVLLLFPFLDIISKNRNMQRKTHLYNSM